jgi:hypothetical protein
LLCSWGAFLIVEEKKNLFDVNVPVETLYR